MKVEIKVTEKGRAVLRLGGQRIADAESREGEAPGWMVRAANIFKNSPPVSGSQAKRVIKGLRMKEES